MACVQLAHPLGALKLVVARLYRHPNIRSTRSFSVAQPSLASRSCSVRRWYAVPASPRGKIYESALDAVADIRSGSTVLSGGFGLCGVAATLIHALAQKPEIKNLTVVSNNAGLPGFGVGALWNTRQLVKLIGSYVGENKDIEKAYLAGQLSVELTPQGTIAERCRAGGAGIPAFYTATGVGTAVETGELVERFNSDGSVAISRKPKETRVFGGKKYLLEEAIKGDVALVRVWKADKYGNCVFRYSAQNHCGPMARSAALTIVEADEIVEIGDLDPNEIHVPGIYVDRVVQATAEKKIAKLVTREREGEQPAEKSDAQLKRELIARRAAQELGDGDYVNLGIGVPMLVPGFVPDGKTIHMQSENGVIGVGPYPYADQVDPDIINAGKESTTLLPGAACFDSAESFAMIRAGKVDVTILGAMQVSAAGDIANYMIPGKLVKGMGGAFDLVSNPDETRVVVCMEHTDKNGKPKLLDQCNLPLGGDRVVSVIVTDLATFYVDRKAGAMTLVETAPGVSIEDVKAKTGARFEVSPNVKEYFT